MSDCSFDEWCWICSFSALLRSSGVEVGVGCDVPANADDELAAPRSMPQVVELGVEARAIFTWTRAGDLGGESSQNSSPLSESELA